MNFEQRTILEPVSVLAFTREPVAYATPPQEHAAISYRVRGGAVFRFLDESVCVRSGDFLYVPPGLSYCQSNAEQEELISVQFICDRREGERICRLTPADPAYCAALMEQMYRAWQENGIGRRPRLLSLLYLLLAELSEPKPGVIREAEHTLCRRFSDPDLSVEEVVRESGMSESGFRRAFIGEFGVSARKYLCRVRLSHADALLRQGEFPVEKVAQCCGFSDVKYFQRVYRAHYGVTPGTVRRACRKQPLRRPRPNAVIQPGTMEFMKDKTDTISEKRER